MESITLLFASLLCGSCAFLSLFHHLPQIKRMVIMLWCLSSLLVITAVMRLISYLLLSNFTYSYVYYHSSLDTSLVYKISALWSGQEGSFLLWALLLQIMGFFLIAIKEEWAGQAFGIYSFISFCITFMCYITNPFLKVDTTPLDGLGLNTALKNPWMVLHPPMVFLAYSALAVLFSLLPASKFYFPAISKHITKWLRISWYFLGIGIISGSIWAYLALGWGGYWAWDPIENAALIPWLLLCSFLHAKKYNPKYACAIPFTAACFGVFLARSGILENQSVHAYASGNRIISVFLLLFLLCMLLFLVKTKYRKQNTLEKPKVFINTNWIYKLIKHIFPPETVVLPLQASKIMCAKMVFSCLNGYAVLILIGTITPILFSFETPMLYYNIISIIFVLLYVFMLLWIDLEWLQKRNIWMLALSTALTIGFILLFKADKASWLLLLWICFMPLSLWLVSCFQTQRKSYYISHLGVLLLMIGSITSSAFEKKAFVIANTNDNYVTIEGSRLAISKLLSNDMLIHSTLTQDILIQNTGITIHQGNLMIPYTTKPLIILFWLGSFMILVQPYFVLLFSYLTNKKLLPLDPLEK